MEQIKDLYNMLHAACCSSSSMSKDQPEGMAAIPKPQGYCHDESVGEVLPYVPGMPTETAQIEIMRAPTAEADTKAEDGYIEEEEVKEVLEDEQHEERENSTILSEKQQQKEAKIVIQDFVKEMVRGRAISVVSRLGTLRECTASLSRKLDIFKIQGGNSVREIPLTDISNIHIGENTEATNIDTPLDELCCTMVLVSGECVTFKFPDITARDTFAMCMLMFANKVHGHGN
eukprot:gnl/MRDRNA2_/MRDRNA2_28450_c0_seq1.p1 gnl/MRDRNA2_/MRDRNA2_28450_c0~~gnl/MRDRNA2_/MRDRNA2_28450_c0_seq1.p1  ORF type:complete len:231 (-),score=56.13 gnl/MRDRNA2_/MRDRNA2_28450_c0_seq1:166-858(-)